MPTTKTCVREQGSQMSVSSDTHREDILRAAIAEFGRVGYSATSTNEIIKQAKVSKGLLFHHFTNKEKLYEACHIHVMEHFGRLLVDRLDVSISDFFERTLYTLKIKMELGCKYPEFLSFVNRAWYLDEENIPFNREELHTIVMDLLGERGVAFASNQGIDTTWFKDGYELAKLVDYTRIIIDATWMRFSRKYDNDMNSMIENIGAYMSEVEEIITLFRDGAYK